MSLFGCCILQNIILRMKLVNSIQLMGFVLGVLFVLFDAFPSSEVSVLETFKEGIYDDPLQILSDWDALDMDPCNWSGIICSEAEKNVIKINISASSLRGFLAPDLGQLKFLEELILHGNNLLGIIPKELGMLEKLKVLDLGKNQLTGPIPLEIGNLTAVVKINLQSNGLTGKLPQAFGNLENLEEFRIDRNKLQGNIPNSDNSSLKSTLIEMHGSTTNLSGLCRASRLKVADFSYNFFVGSIPKCLEYLPRSSFQGNCLQNKEPKQRSSKKCGGASPSGVITKSAPDKGYEHKGASKPKWLSALEIVTGSILGSLFLAFVFATLRKCKTKSSIIIPWKKPASDKDHVAVYIDSEMLKDVVRFSREELEVACEDFSNIIGSSPDSLVYKGTMKGGPEIAVISLCIKEEHWTGFLELYFQREVADLARLNHDNTGKLLGYCKENRPFTRMLVFEYASNGTLYEHLHYGEGCQLSWARRMKIILGISRGLKYLHTELDPPFTILELTSSAVYLTDEFSPKLVDFENWKTIIARSEKNSCYIGSQGAICVLPNSLERRELDLQGNMYAFGLLLLEIISGKPPYCKDKGCLVNWAKDYLDVSESVYHIVDPELKQFKQDELKVICEVVNLCINPEPAKRPSIKELCNMLETRIDTSLSASLKASSLAWAELALSSQLT